MRALRFSRWWIAFGVALVLVVLYFSLKSSEEGGASLIPDKLSHVLAFFGLTGWFAALVERRNYKLIAVLMLTLGVAIEWLQDQMALGRTAEIADVYANALGIAFGLAVSLLISESWLQRVECWLFAP